jgi:hypothetical protein
VGLILLSPVFLGTESTPSPIGLITLGVKPAGKRSAVNPHAPFEVTGDGNLAYAVAPFLDPTPLTQGMVSGLR